MTTANDPIENDPRYGWIMVIIVFTLSALSFGSLGSISVFLKPLSMEFGWSRGMTSFFGWGGMGLGGFINGYLYDLTNNYLGSYTFHSLMGVVNLVILALFSLRIYRSRRSLDTAGAQY